jgi:hypothetical protein
MARVPRVTGVSATTAAMPNVRQNLSAPAEAFGGTAARQMAETGRNLSTAGNKLDDVATKIQEQTDLDLVFQADTALKNQYLEFQQSANNRKGVQAWGLAGETKKWFDDNITKIGGNLSERQKRVFLQRAETLRLQGLDYYGRYELDERNKATAASTEANTLSAIDVAASDPTPGNIAASTKLISQNADANARLFGWSPEVLAAKKAEDLGKLHQQVLQGLVENDPMQAEAYYNEHKAEIPGAMQAEIGKAVRIGTAKEKAQALVDKVMASGLSEAAALDMIRSEYSGDEEDIYVSAVKSRFNEIDAARNRAEKENRDAAYDAVARAGGDLSRVPAGVISRLGDYDRAQLDAYAERISSGKAIKTDLETYDQLSKLAREQPEAFVDYDLLQHRSQLSDTDFKRFTDLKASLAKPEKVTDIATLEQQLTSRHEALGLTGSDTEGAKAAKRARFDKMARDALDGFKTREGREPTYKEREELLDRLMLPGTLKGSGVIWDDEARLYEVIDTSDADKFEITVPDDDRTRIVNSFKARGVNDPTDEQILQAYRRAKGIQ